MAYGASGTLLVGLTLPVVLALISGVVLICGVWFAVATPPDFRHAHANWRTFLPSLVIVLPALPSRSITTRSLLPASGSTNRVWVGLTRLKGCSPGA